MGEGSIGTHCCLLLGQLSVACALNLSNIVYWIHFQIFKCINCNTVIKMMVLV